jgi:formylmethanofuran dehydrogenase subunit B
MSDDLLGITPEDAALLLELMDKCHMMRHTEMAVKLMTRLQAHAKLVIPPMGKDKVWYGSTGLLRKTNKGYQFETIVRAGSRTECRA